MNAQIRDDEELWELFSNQSLQASEWNHEAHVRVAYLHLARWPLDAAHIQMRVGIIRLNATHGLVETETRGYHETLTRFWLLAVASRREDLNEAANQPLYGKRTAQREERAHTATSSHAFCKSHPELLKRSLPLKHYQEKTLFSSRARACWMPPDVKPI